MIISIEFIDNGHLPIITVIDFPWILVSGPTWRGPVISFFLSWCSTIHIIWIRDDIKYKVSMTIPVSMSILQFHCYSSSYYQVTCTGYDHVAESSRSCVWKYTIHRFWNYTIILLNINDHSIESIRSKWQFEQSKFLRHAFK